MVYHEVRVKDREKQNYLVSNTRENGKWKKRSKFIGSGDLSKKEISKLKKEFEIKLKTDIKNKYLSREQVEEIERLKQKYSDNLDKLSKEEFEKFEKSFFTELTYNSNAIEGSSLSLAETSLVVNEGLVPEGKTIREVHEAKNHKQAINFIKSYKGDLDEQFILKIHSIILKGISERFAGKYRQTNVKIFGSDVKFPSSEKVPQLVRNLIYWYKKHKKNYHQFELAVIVSMRFVTIHPFIDGNGRVSRLLMNFLLSKKSYPWINIYNKNRQKYLDAVQKANNEDYDLVFPFLIKTLNENLDSFGFE
ncbi:MAG: Fic family protein [Nanoarchaeota archaeon]|nr:Fic family protein [Nanoarchaeota archaeon]